MIKKIFAKKDAVEIEDNKIPNHNEIVYHLIC